MNCVDGRGYVFDCPEGLAFNQDSYRCDWPDQVESCDAEGMIGDFFLSEGCKMLNVETENNRK
jgi:hypothetical protein